MNNKNTNNTQIGKGTAMRKFSRLFHRHLSFFFAGVIFIYAISGFCLNHKRDFNSHIKVDRLPLSYQFATQISAESVNKDFIVDLMTQMPDKELYTRHAMVGDNHLKVFFKGGSSLEVDLDSGTAMYEKVRKRPVISKFNRLHYNPSRWWTLFSDIFAISLIIITLTGFLMMKGPKGFWGIGGLEFAAGLLIPLAFMFL